MNDVRNTAFDSKKQHRRELAFSVAKTAADSIL